MPIESLAAALEDEHREIDQGVEAFTSGLVEGERRPEPLARAMRALRRHIYLEERFLFPPLREAGLVPPVFVMLREHAQIWQTLDTLEALVADDAPDADLRQACRELTVRLQHHNLNEERILYPEADRVLTASVDADLRAVLESGEMPEGWVCERARA